MTREQRFEQVFRDTFDDVFRYALRRTDTDTAHEVAAETYMTAWRRLGDMPEPPLPWLYGIAKFVIANNRRAARRRGRLLQALAGVARGPQEPDREVFTALLALRELDREALMLTAWEGLSTREAAAAAGCSEATMRVRLHRARRRYARLLDAANSSTFSSLYPLEEGQ